MGARTILLPLIRRDPYSTATPSPVLTPVIRMIQGRAVLYLKVLPITVPGGKNIVHDGAGCS